MKNFEGCPGSQAFDFREKTEEKEGEPAARIESELRQWPIQMHLISPVAPYFQGADVALVADCVPFAMGDFHRDYLKGKSIGIACPKLDDGQDMYAEKVKSWIETAKINTLTIMIMQVPCCMGLVSMVQEVIKNGGRKIPVKYVIVGLQGEVLQEEWLAT